MWPGAGCAGPARSPMSFTPSPNGPAAVRPRRAVLRAASAAGRWANRSSSMSRCPSGANSPSAKAPWMPSPSSSPPGKARRGRPARHLAHRGTGRPNHDHSTVSAALTYQHATQGLDKRIANSLSEIAMGSAPADTPPALRAPGGDPAPEVADQPPLGNLRAGRHGRLDHYADIPDPIPPRGPPHGGSWRGTMAVCTAALGTRRR